MLQWLRDLAGHLTAAVTGRVYSRRSTRWPAVRARHLQREPECQACGAVEHLQVHHVVPVHVDPSRELDDDNLISLCEPPGPGGCHLSIGHLGSWRRWNTAVRGHCQIIRQARATSG